jgi:hypothetical protein
MCGQSPPFQCYFDRPQFRNNSKSCEKLAKGHAEKHRVFQRAPRPGSSGALFAAPQTHQPERSPFMAIIRQILRNVPPRKRNARRTLMVKIFMTKTLNDELMVVLLKVQPPKQRIPADYVVSRPIAGSCHQQTCTGTCRGSCHGGCTRSCKGRSR